jgi:hypothetical protein
MPLFDRTSSTFYNWYRFPFPTKVELTSQLSDIATQLHFWDQFELLKLGYYEKELLKALSDHFFGLIHQCRQQNVLHWDKDGKKECYFIDKHQVDL